MTQVTMTYDAQRSGHHNCIVHLASQIIMKEMSVCTFEISISSAKISAHKQHA